MTQPKLRSASSSLPRRSIAGVVAAALIVVGFLVASTSATAAVQTKFYSATATPVSMYAAVPTQVTVTLTNSASSNQSFGSAELAIGNLPSSAISFPAHPSIASWDATLAGTKPAVIKLTSPSGPAVAPGGAISIPVTITAPASPSQFTIGTQVRQSNDFAGAGNNFLHASGNSDPVITVIPLTLQFVPSSVPPAIQQSVPAKHSFSYMCPEVQVYANGAPLPIAGVSVTLSALVPPDPGLVFGTSATQATDGSGLATFGNCGSAPPTGVAATNLGPNFHLSASSPSAATPATSPAFAVDQVVAICTNGQCPPITPSGNSGTTADETISGNQTFTVDSSFGLGLTLVCDSAVATVPADPIVTTTSGAASGTISLTFPKAVVNSIPDNGTPHMPVCTGANQPFLGGSLVPTSPQSPYPYQGLILDCSDPNYIANAMNYPLQFCVQSRAKVGGGGETVVIFDSSFVDDPMHW